MCQGFHQTSGLDPCSSVTWMMPCTYFWGFFWEWRSSAWSSQCLATRNSSPGGVNDGGVALLPLPGCRMLCIECPWQLWQAPCWKSSFSVLWKNIPALSSARRLITSLWENDMVRRKDCLKLICLFHPNWTFTHLQAFFVVNFSVLSCYDH